MRCLEKKRDTFPTFQKRCLQAVKDYPAKGKLVGSMAKRVRMVLDKNGAMIDK